MDGPSANPRELYCRGIEGDTQARRQLIVQHQESAGIPSRYSQDRFHS